MTKPRLSREILLPKLAAHVLEHGLSDASLRPLAKAAGTSDRMLLYHFGSKDQLVAELLDHLAVLYSTALDSAFPAGPAASRQAGVEQLLAIVRTPPFAPFMRLWWELVAGAATGNADYRESARAMMDRLLAWFESQMPDGDPDPKGGAQLLFTLIEGTLMLDTLGQGDIADAGLESGFRSGLRGP